jgi:tellurite resistance protein TerC
VFLFADQVVAAPVAALDVAPSLWIGFFAGTAVLLMLDMFVFHRHAHEPTLRESALWTLFWCSLALIFNGWIWWEFGQRHALEFLMGYLVEWSLSMDNVFVFVVIFSYFHVPLKYQYRVLFWGILGAIVMRLTFILVANELIHRFEWIMYVFGAFLLYTGVKLAAAHDAESHPDQNFVLRFARKYLRVARGTHEDRFFVRQVDVPLEDTEDHFRKPRPSKGRWHVTSLFLVLLVVESTDVLFAIDSVPAIFGITKEPFIVFTSNVFAIMGLRALYFLLAGVINMFRYLHYGLAAILCFIGIKMLLHHVWEPPHWLSLLVILLLLGTSIVASLVAAWRERRLMVCEPAEVLSKGECAPPDPTEESVS